MPLIGNTVISTLVVLFLKQELFNYTKAARVYVDTVRRADRLVNERPTNLYKRICCTCFNIYSPVNTEISGNVENL